MGRYAQQQKRGGHQSTDGGLPAGPLLTDFSASYTELALIATWERSSLAPFGFWITRWRQPAVSLAWTMQTDGASFTEYGNLQGSPLIAVTGSQYHVEAAYCDTDGNLLSGWSGFQVINT